MTDDTKPKRNRLVVDLTDEDRAWIRDQAESTGWGSEALVVRMLIRDARVKGVNFAVVASGPQAAYGVGPGMAAVRELRVREAERRVFRPTIPPGYSFNGETGEIDTPPPVEPEYLDDVLANRLNEVGAAAMAAATEPWPEMTPPPPNGSAVAVSLEPAPKRQAKDYR